MTHIPNNHDRHLHNPDGTHHATPKAQRRPWGGGWKTEPVTSGAALDLWEKQMQRHQERHRQIEKGLLLCQRCGRKKHINECIGETD